MEEGRDGDPERRIIKSFDSGNVHPCWTGPGQEAHSLLGGATAELRRQAAWTVWSSVQGAGCRAQPQPALPENYGLCESFWV